MKNDSFILSSRWVLKDFRLFFLIIALVAICCIGYINYIQPMQKAILKPGIYVVLSIRQTYAMGTAQQTGRPASIVEVCPIEGGDVKMVPLPEGVRIPPQDPVASSFTIKVGSPTDPWHVYSMRSGQEILPEPETESMLSSQ